MLPVVVLTAVVLAGQIAGGCLPVVRPAVLAASLLALDLVGSLYSARAVRYSAVPMAWRFAAAGRGCSMAATITLLSGAVSGEPVLWWAGLAMRGAMFLCLATGAMIRPIRSMSGHRLAGYLAEIVTLCGGGFMVLWYFVLNPVLSHPNLGSRLAFMSFAVGDLLLAVGVISLALSGVRMRLASPLTIYATGLALYAVADFSWSTVRQRGGDPGGSAAASLVMVTASLLLTVAPMIVVGGWAGHAKELRLTMPNWSLYVPQILLAAVCALLLSLLVRRSGLSLWGGLFAGLVLVSLGVLVQQYVAIQALRNQVVRDPLTGLANRAGIDVAAERALRRSEPCALLLLDVDGLKLVNDAYGYRAGDAVLAEIGRRLATAVRGPDVCGRLSGGEFAVLMPGPGTATGPMSQADAAIVAQRILDAVAEHPFAVDQDAVRVRASMGLTVGTAGDTARELFRRADLALRHAKAAGAHGFVPYDPVMVDRRAEDAALSDDLDAALQEGQLMVVYQPLVDLAGEQSVGAEALLRWQHPTRGSVSPMRFIPLAERSGTIVGIGLWVLEQACHQARSWQRQTLSGPARYISVNLSPRQLRDPALVPGVLDVLARTGLEPQHLVLEVTESAIVDEDGGLPTLRALRAHGIRIAIDDFGTGYSSLQYLTRLPVDILKIDRSFVAQLDGTPEGSAIAEAVVRLSQALHLTTVAEGIETSEQATALRRLGCDIGQGYLYARPMPPAECTATMTAPRPEVSVRPVPAISVAGTGPGLSVAAEPPRR